MAERLVLPCDTPERIARLAQMGHAIGAAVFVTGPDDRFEAANQSYRTLFPCVSFDDRPLFADAFLQSVYAGINDDPALTADPQRYLHNITMMRLSTCASFVKSWGERRALCVHLRFGSWTARLSVDLEKNLADQVKKIGKINDVELLLSMFQTSSLLVATLDHIPQPTALVSEDCELSYWNTAFMRLIQARSILAVTDGGRLSAYHQRSDTTLRSAIAKASALSRFETTLLIQPVDDSGVQFASVTSAHMGFAMVQLPPLDLDHAVISGLRSIGLPPGRARVAAALGGGMTVSEVADKFQIAEATVRTEIKNLTAFWEGRGFGVGKGLRAIYSIVSRISSIARSQS